jgi:hypothetical protein
MIQYTLTLLDDNLFQLKDILTDSDQLYPAEQFVNKIVALKVVTRALSGSQHQEGRQRFEKVFKIMQAD